ncbi:signal transduction histidine kinase [Herbihabitans rhizosphaerae]|uniref:Signal transduction histidine kinase n=1 Tax=Herbihabitans rhizosphaerae TaxID=1872711 RepID=A0A4Q7KBT9_9PSEU|nr:sensor histidine kinase [Herbihabitans rhizosphaerae]RZS29843.1 signal transduction histidine kinase [Herbihabitans rhizosphaerae]
MKTPHPDAAVTAVDRENGFDVWERQENKLFAALPYLLLATSVVITLLQLDRVGHLHSVVLVAPAAALWTMWWYTLHPEWPRTRPDLMGIYYVGFLAFCAALVADAPWFAIYAWVGYVHAFDCLRGLWRIPGIGATAVLMATAQVGGVEKLPEAGLATWLVIFAMNAAVAGAFAYLGYRTSEQNEKRKQAVHDLEDANRKLEDALEENAGLHAQLLAQAREAGALDERQRLASEIHDTLAQGFTGIVTQLQAAEQAKHDPVRWQRHLDTAAALARENLAEARRSVHALSPEALDAAPLPDALADVVRRWSDIHGVRADFTTTGTPRPMHPELEATLLRVTQEALSNVGKHAQASRVGLTLSYMEDQITLDVRDDGVGFDQNSLPGNGKQGGFGLTGMRRRLQRLAGSLSIESEVDGGTAISASLPALEAPQDVPPTHAPDGLLTIDTSASIQEGQSR